MGPRFVVDIESLALLLTQLCGHLLHLRQVTVQAPDSHILTGNPLVGRTQVSQHFLFTMAYKQNTPPPAS